MTAYFRQLAREGAELRAPTEGLPVLTQVKQDGKLLQECAWCGEQKRGKEREMRHVMTHFLAPEMMPRKGRG